MPFSPCVLPFLAARRSLLDRPFTHNEVRPWKHISCRLVSWYFPRAQTDQRTGHVGKNRVCWRVKARGEQSRRVWAAMWEAGKRSSDDPLCIVQHCLRCLGDLRSLVDAISKNTLSTQCLSFPLCELGLGAHRVRQLLIWSGAFPARTSKQPHGLMLHFRNQKSHT